MTTPASDSLPPAVSAALSTHLLLRATWTAWVLFAVVIGAVVVSRVYLRDHADSAFHRFAEHHMKPLLKEGSVTPSYRKAAEAWWEGKDLYTRRGRGFLYLPQAAILSSALTWMPEWLGEMLYRLVSISLVSLALWRLARTASPGRQVGMFAFLSLLTLPLAAGNASNGQANLPLADLLALAAVDLAQSRWNRASLLLLFALAIKPLALVMILLAGALYWRTMSWRLTAGIAVMLALPFLGQHPDYVARQYRQALGQMAAAAEPLPKYPDTRGMLVNLFHFDPGEPAMRLVRLAAAGLCLGLTWLGKRRWGEPRGALLLLATAATYLMLFNPRTEGTSYVIVMPAVALFAGWALFHDRWRWAASGLVSIAVLANFDDEIARPLQSMGGVQIVRTGTGPDAPAAVMPRKPGVGVRPLLCFLFAAYLVWLVANRREPARTLAPSRPGDGRPEA